MVETAPAWLKKADSNLKCPECGSKRLYRDGLRYLKDNSPVQRYLCRDCGFRFSDSSKRQILKIRSPLTYNCQVGGKAGLPKNLASKAVYALAETTGKTTSGPAGATQTSQDQADVKGKIIEFLIHMKKENREVKTIEIYNYYLTRLVKLGANLLDPESIKEVLSKKKGWSANTRRIAATAYMGFANFHGIPFKKPKYTITRKVPFLPLEHELDSLIAGSPRKMATFLQLLKETGLRAGEALRLTWKHIDFQRKLIYVNETEKSGKARTLKISDSLISMLKRLDMNKKTVFAASYSAMESWYTQIRKRLAYKLQNPRLLRISFHTFRHWKATMEYHRTKDLLYVMQMLGHRRIETTLIYTQLVNFESEEYHSAVAANMEQARKLVEAGFEYVCDMEGIKLFRKRK